MSGLKELEFIGFISKMCTKDTIHNYVIQLCSYRRKKYFSSLLCK